MSGERKCPSCGKAGTVTVTPEAFPFPRELRFRVRATGWIDFVAAHREAEGSPGSWHLNGNEIGICDTRYGGCSAELPLVEFGIGTT